MRLMVFTDGSAHSKDRTGGWAFLVTDASTTKWFRLEFAPDTDTTNNRMELLSVIRGITHALTVDEVSEIIVNTDSQYVKQVYDFKGLLDTWEMCGWITSTGTQVKNRDLWEQLKTILKSSRVPIRFKKIKAHSGHDENEYVDRAASIARKNQKRGYAQIHVYEKRVDY